MAINLSKDRPLILVGPPGSGKTFIGKLLSRKAALPFFDLDEMIEAKCHLSVDEIFSQKKESYFRLIESQCLREFSQRPLPSRYILATGGGTIISVRNFELLQRLGNLIYLKASPKKILERVSEKTRPLFKNKSQKDIEGILKNREKFYQKSDWVFETLEKSFSKISQEIMQIYL